MRATCLMAAMLVVVASIAGPASAEPKVAVYFDAGLTQRTIDCPGPGLDTLYVVAEDFNSFISGVEFKIDYPPNVIWLADLDAPPVTIGTTATGISMGFALPQNAFGQLQILRVIILWNCVDCSLTNAAVGVGPNPIGGLRATKWPDFSLIDAGPKGAVICPVPNNMDIKPGSCPNAFNIQFFYENKNMKARKGGVTTVALLGSASFDVTQVDPASLLLEGVAPLAQAGGPTMKDVGTALGDLVHCECTEENGDGFMDLVMKFDTQDLANGIGAKGLGEYLLTMTGDLLNGVPFSAEDCIKVVGKDIPPPVPFDTTAPALFNPYPNPFNPTTRLSFSVPTDQRVRLAVYDVAGREIDVLVDEFTTAGVHTIDWDASHLASGVYFYRLDTETKSMVKRMTLLK